MDAGHPVARPDVRRRHDRDRSRAKAADIAPGLQRTFGFQKLAWFGRSDVAANPPAARATGCAPAPAEPPIFASDIEPRALGAMPPQCRSRGNRGMARRR
jgi:hypothetical protein